jgi:hypothetical protein
VRTPAGERRVGARLEIATVPPAPAPRLAWTAEGAALIGRAEDARLAAVVRLAPGGGAGFEATVEIRWKAAVEVERAALRLRLPGPARALGRDLRLAEVRTPVRADAGTPVLVLGGGMAVVGGPGLAAALYEPDRAGNAEVSLMLDDAGAHPFAVYERCLDRLPPGRAQGYWAALERKRSLARMRRAPGELSGAAFQLLPLRTGSVPAPLVPGRWPGEARAALVLTDHADRTDPAALRAVLWGDSDRAAPGYGSRGILGRGLALTKSFFARDRTGGLLDDPEAAVLAQELAAAGSEVALHSPGPGADDREGVRAALAELAPFRLVTWIDHQPYTNCEAFSSQGWQVGGRFGIRDLLVEAGFRWVWEANDLGGFGRPRLENLLAAARPGRADPPVYPLPIDPRLWVFQSTFFYGTPAELGAALSEEGLDALQAAQGLFVGHTYLSASDRTTRDALHRRWLAVRRRAGGGLGIAPELDAGLARAARRVRAGAVAALTLREAGDRLRAMAAVRLVYLADGAARVENHGGSPVRQLQLALAAEAALEVEGAEAGGHALDPARSRVFFDLAAGQAAVVRARGARGPVPFLEAEPAATLAP